MITTNENTWNDDLNNQGQGGGSNSFGTAGSGDTTNRNYSDDVNENSGIDENSLDDTEGSGGNIPGSYSSNESMSGSNSPDDDDDADVADDDLDYDEDLDGDTTTIGGSYSSGVTGLSDPDELPEEGESENEGTGYSQQPEQGQQQSGADTSFSEQVDVTPPNQHEFPSTGTATQTDFASRNHGRTTGRMVGHEPGTEGI